MPFPILVKIKDRHGKTIRGPGGLYGVPDAVIGYAFRHQVKLMLDTHDYDHIPVLHEPVSFLKEIDNTTPVLNRFLTSGDDLQEIELSFYKTNGTHEHEKYYSINLEQVNIVRIKPFSKMVFLEKNKPYRLMEQVDVVYKVANWTWHDKKSVIMSMHERPEPIEEQPPVENNYERHLAALQKQHPFVPVAALKSIARSNAAQDALWEKIENNHWVEVQYLYPDKTGVDNLPYFIKLSNGQTEKGVLSKNSTLRYNNLPKGEVYVELGESVDEELIEIRKEIKQTLDQMLEAKREETSRVLEEFNNQTALGKTWDYTAATAGGFYEGGKGLVLTGIALYKTSRLFNIRKQSGNALKAAYRAFQQGEYSEDTWKQRFAQQWKKIRHEEYIEALGFDPTEIDPEQIAQAYELTALIMDDKPTWNIISSFASDYAAAHNRLDVAQIAGGAAFEIVLGLILAVLTAGASIAAQSGSKSFSLIQKLKPLLQKLFKLLKKKKLNKKFNGGIDTKHVKEVEVPEPPDLPGPPDLKTAKHSDNGDSLVHKKTTKLSWKNFKTPKEAYAYINGLKGDTVKIAKQRIQGLSKKEAEQLKTEIREWTKEDYPGLNYSKIDKAIDNYTGKELMKKDIDQIKDYIFKDKLLAPKDNIPKELQISYYRQTEQWLKLSNGKGSVNETTFLRHELSEMLIKRNGGLEKYGQRLGRNPNFTHADAHMATDEIFDCSNFDEIFMKDNF